MPKFTYVVLTNAVPGKEQEFDQWYSGQHVPDVLRVPGVLSAQRFRRTAQQRGTAPQPWQYLALYECDARDPQVITDGIQARIGTPEMPMSDSLADVRYACYFEPITDVIRRQDAR
ncbi:DUF4286 family protein [Burkholderia sp. Ax-1719]|jgi:hypothetical protein|uniref:DUF4286 family protein n=1 Tax=Burkholderia sp. Ax-1719 TaxID=2608334 RepID=UPI00141DBD31|nr:DUF4286 family protein [Burkholderia sp. Ax-1719]NIE64400.1 hypothetical protein [Burkholderia sp. Ax-1719]